MRTILIGDIHGCNRALCALLEKLKPGKEDRLVLLGDLFDRGAESWEVFQTVKELEKQFGERFALLRGNHEDYLLKEKMTIRQRMVWESVGRAATVKSFIEHESKMKDAIPWIREHCRMFYRDEEIQCVHAGILVEPIEANDNETMIHDHGIALRNVYHGRVTVVGHIGLDVPKWFAGDGETVLELEYGVWRELPEKGIICIDTGSGKDGFLSGMIIEDGRYRLERA